MTVGKRWRQKFVYKKDKVVLLRIYCFIKDILKSEIANLLWPLFVKGSPQKGLFGDCLLLFCKSLINKEEILKDWFPKKISWAMREILERFVEI